MKPLSYAEDNTCRYWRRRLLDLSRRLWAAVRAWRIRAIPARPRARRGVLGLLLGGVG
jgi:hypothetical protein